MSFDTTFLTLPLLLGAFLLFAGILIGTLSARAGFSFLVIFLLVGAMAGEDGPFGVVFNDFYLSFALASTALAIILIDGGLRSNLSTLKAGFAPAIMLATVGVLITVGIVAIASHFILGLSWPLALILGSIVGSTDSAAVFGLLGNSTTKLSERVSSTLEIESGSNDPMAIYLTLFFIAVALQTQSASDSTLQMGSLFGDGAVLFVQQFGWGALLGIGCGLTMGLLVNWLRRFHDTGGGLTALLILSAGLIVFAFTTWIGGSGFLAAYIFGIVLGYKSSKALRPALPAMDAYAWLAQAGFFFC